MCSLLALARVTCPIGSDGSNLRTLRQPSFSAGLSVFDIFQLQLLAINVPDIDRILRHLYHYVILPMNTVVTIMDAALTAGEVGEDAGQVIEQARKANVSASLVQPANFCTLTFPSD